MKRVAILTDFASHDPAYSLCGVVANQVKMLVENGYKPTVIVKEGFNGIYPGCEVVGVDPGRTSNSVKVDKECDAEIDSLEQQLRDALGDIDVVLTHDLIYQASMWKYHVACRRLVKDLPNIKWLHWVHSSTSMNTADKTGKYKEELKGKFPNSTIVVFHAEEMVRKAGSFGYEIDEAVILSNPLDLTEGYHPAALEAIKVGGLHKADAIAVYPARLDRGKQVEIVLEVFGGLAAQDIDARVVVIDFHSTAGDKATYRTNLERMAAELNVPTIFTSDLQYPNAPYHLPHQAVLDLMDYADIFIHPSRSESDPLTVPEAMWKRCGLMLNFDLPLFRQWDGKALFGKFSSNVDVLTGQPGETNTEYSNRDMYMYEMASKIAYILRNNPVLANHIEVRKTRGLEAHWQKLWAAIEA